MKYFVSIRFVYIMVFAWLLLSKISIDSKDKYRGYTEKKNLHCSIYLDRRWKKYNKSRPHYKYPIIGRYKHKIW